MGASLGRYREVIGGAQIRPGYRQPAKATVFVVEVNALCAATVRVRNPFELTVRKRVERVRYAETIPIDCSGRCSPSGLPTTVVWSFSLLLMIPLLPKRSSLTSVFPAIRADLPSS